MNIGKWIYSNSEKLFFIINSSVLACVSCCLYGIDKQYILLWLILSYVFQLILFHQSGLDMQSVFLLLGMIIHSFACEGKMGKIEVSLTPFLFYCLGKRLVQSDDKSKIVKRTKLIILILTIGLFLNSVLNAIEYYLYGLEEGRRWKEFWSQMSLPGTQHVFWDLLIVGLIFYGIFYIKKDFITNAILILGGGWSLWFSLVTGSRLLCMVFVVVLGINVLLFWYLNWGKKSVKYSVLICAITLALISIMLIGLWKFDLFGFQSRIQNSFWSRDGGILHNIRFQAQISALKQLFKYPFGGRQMELAGLYFAHNVWLDMANASGIFSFTCIVIYTLCSFGDIYKLVKEKTLEKDIKHFLVSAYFSLWLYYMVETALDADLMLWAVWALVCGVIKSNIVTNKKPKNKLA